MGLEQQPPEDFVIPKANYDYACQLVQEGNTRFIFAFSTPDGNIAYRVLSGEIVDLVKQGKMRII